jgi:hypothetical protein
MGDRGAALGTSQSQRIQNNESRKSPKIAEESKILFVQKWIYTKSILLF